MLKTHVQALIILRQIIRVIYLHSNKLERELGIRVPQLLIMQIIHDEDL